MTRTLPIVDRIRLNVRALLRAPGRRPVRQNAIAKATGLSGSQVSSFLNGRYGISIKHIDAMAYALGVSSSELVKRTDEPLFELTAIEATVIGYLRSWTPDVQRSFVVVLDFLHARLPSDTQTIQMFQYWGKMNNAQRAIVSASALRHLDEELPPELKATLGIQETDAPRPRTRGKRRVKGGDA